MANVKFAVTNLHFLLLLLLTAPAAADVQLPEFNAAEPIAVTAQAANRWQLGAYEVWLLRGDCTIRQGQGYARGREAVLWIDRAEASERRPDKVIAYLEGNVEIVFDRRPGAGDCPDFRSNENGTVPFRAPLRITDRAWLGRFFSSAGVNVRAAATAGKPDALPEIYWRGIGAHGRRNRAKEASGLGRGLSARWTRAFDRRSLPFLPPL